MTNQQVSGLLIVLLIGSTLLSKAEGPAGVAVLAQVLVAAAALANALRSRKG